MKEKLLNKGMAGLHLDDAEGNALYSKGKSRQNNSNNSDPKKHNNKNQNKFKGNVTAAASMVTNVQNATRVERLATTVKIT